MGLLQNILPPKERLERSFTWGDIIVILLMAVLIYGGARLAFDAPAFIEGPQISLGPTKKNAHSPCTSPNERFYILVIYRQFEDTGS